MTPKTFSEFWPYYLSQHSRPATRILHVLGSSLGLLIVIAALAFHRWMLVPLALIPGYGLAWGGHFAFEKNRPATFQFPLWSFAADWKMWALMLTGRL